MRAARAGLERPRSRRSGLAEAWRAAALLLFNTLVVLLLANLVAAGGLLLLRRPPGSLRYGVEKLSAVYPGRSPAEIESLLRETWTRTYVYAPFVQHREGPASGEFVNVERAGFRRSADQAGWPPPPDQFSIFVFGGSTTFGYGVADDETIPSRLQRALADSSCPGPPRLYNFGRGNYYSEQERVLFASLLAAGRAPAVALFIDGLNEWKEAPKYTARLSYLMAESAGQRARRSLLGLPVLRLAKRLRAGLEAEPARQPPAAQRRLAAAAVERYLSGKRLTEAVAAEFDVLPLFVWQPVPTWGYRLESHALRAESAAALAAHGPLRLGYEQMERRRTAAQLGDNFLWLADAQRGRDEPLYVDAAHYTAAFSDEIARLLARWVAAKVPCGGAAG